MKLLHALAHDDSTAAEFPKQQTAAYLMQVVEGTPLRYGPGVSAAAATAADCGSGQPARDCLTGTSSRNDLAAGSGGGDADVSSAVKALEVLVAASRVGTQLLTGVKVYPGGRVAGRLSSAYAGMMGCGTGAATSSVCLHMTCASQSKRACSHDVFVGDQVQGTPANASCWPRYMWFHLQHMILAAHSGNEQSCSSSC